MSPTGHGLRCQNVLKPNDDRFQDSSWPYSVDIMAISKLNDIIWEKPTHLLIYLAYFTHSTETIIWAAKTEKSKHISLR